MSKQLNLVYWLLIGILLLFFALLVTFIVGIPTPQPWATIDTSLSLFGCLGYLFLVMGLLNAVVLFSLNLTSAAIASLFPSLIINFIVGYIAANAIAPDWAVFGLIMGSAVFMFLSCRQVLKAIKNPDYAYYLGGY